MARPPPLPGPERARRSPSAARPAVRGPERGECRRGPQGTAGSGAGGRLVAPARARHPERRRPSSWAPQRGRPHPRPGPPLRQPGPGEAPWGRKLSPDRIPGSGGREETPRPPHSPPETRRRSPKGPLPPAPGSLETQISCTCSLPADTPTRTYRPPALLQSPLFTLSFIFQNLTTLFEASLKFLVLVLETQIGPTAVPPAVTVFPTFR